MERSTVRASDLAIARPGDTRGGEMQVGRKGDMNYGNDKEQYTCEGR